MIARSPIESFVQFHNFTDTEADICVEAEDNCLPVYTLEDLSFQLYIENMTVGEEADYAGGFIEFFVRVCDCTQILPSGYGTMEENFTFHVKELQGEGEPIQLLLSSQFSADTVFSGLDNDECFSLCIIMRVDDGAGNFQDEVLACAGCFKRVTDKCFTTLVEYRNNESGLGFMHPGDVFYDTFYLSARLPMWLRKPQYTFERTGYRKSTGTYKKLSSRGTEEHEVITDYMDRVQHRALSVALEFDEILMSNDNAMFTSQEIYFEDMYEIDWKEFNNYPLAQSQFKVKTSPFNELNTNCT